MSTGHLIWAVLQLSVFFSEDSGTVVLNMGVTCQLSCNQIIVIAIHNSNKTIVMVVEVTIT